MVLALIFVLAFVAAIAVLGLLGLRVFRQAKALTSALTAAAEQLSAVSAALGEDPSRASGFRSETR